MRILFFTSGIAFFLFLGWTCSTHVESTGETIVNETAAQLLEEARRLSNSSPVASSQLALKALAEGVQQNQAPVIGAAQFILCTFNTSPLAIDSTLAYCHAAVTYFDKKKDIQQKGILYNSMGIHYDVKGEKEKAVYYFEEAEKAFKALSDNYWLGEMYNNWGVVYASENNSDKALAMYMMALEYNRSIDNARALMASHNNLGRLYYKKHLYEQALDHGLTCLTLAKIGNNATWLPLALNLIGDIYTKTNKQEEALVNYKSALAIAEANNDDYNRIFTLNRLAKIYVENGDSQKALAYSQLSLDRAKMAGKRKDLEEIYLIIGQCKINLGFFKEAKPYIDTAYSLAQESRISAYVLQSYKLYGLLYAKREEYPIAISFMRRYEELGDTIRDLENAELLSRMEQEFKSKQQEKQIFELREKAAEQNLLLVLALGVFSILTVLILGLLAYFKKVRKLSNDLEMKVEERTKALEKSNIQLERFAYIASHDLKTPLRTISSFLTLIKRKIRVYNNPELEDLLDFASNGAKQMNNLIEDVLGFSKINTIEMKKETLDLNLTLRSVLYNIDDYVKEKGSKVVFSDLPIVEGNAGYLHQLFQNLIVNGIKYNEKESPQVDITFEEKETLFCFFIKDNGIGIDLTYKEQIFEMFKRLHSSKVYEGTGIGLALCQKIVEQHGGEIWLEQSNENGSTFCFSIPKVI
ncbi:MAG: tetratricopeptide repeat protein [Saprospiraceae bacterium]